MRKRDAEGLLFLLILGAIIYPFVWVYEHLGGLALAGAILFPVTGLVVTLALRTRRQQQSFDRIVLLTLRGDVHPRDGKALNRTLARTDIERASFLRAVQIMRDCVEIALSSKKRDTAEYRLGLLRKEFSETVEPRAALVSPAVMAEIRAAVESTEREYHTVVHINAAQRHLDRLPKLKSDKAKQKYLDLALAELAEGLADPLADHARLEGPRAAVAAGDVPHHPG